MLISCEGIVSTDVNGSPVCLDMSSAPLAWSVEEDFDIAEIDAVIASGAFAAGFVIVGSAWAIGRGVKIVLDMLK